MLLPYFPSPGITSLLFLNIFKKIICRIHYRESRKKEFEDGDGLRFGNEEIDIQGKKCSKQLKWLWSGVENLEIISTFKKQED